MARICIDICNHPIKQQKIDIVFETHVKCLSFYIIAQAFVERHALLVNEFVLIYITTPLNNKKFIMCFSKLFSKLVERHALLLNEFS